MKAMMPFIIATLSFFLLTGCNSPEKEIEKTILDNLKYAEEENLDGYVGTLLLTKENRDFTVEQAKSLFENEELDYKLISFKILELKDDTAEVEVIQTTKSRNQPSESFRDSKVTSIHSMKRVEGVWKLSETNIQKSEYEQ